MKKLLATLLASAMALSAIGGLVACGEAEAPEVAATGITLSRTTMTLNPDGQKGIIPTLEPANATTEVVWTSSDEKIATVQDGLVTALDTGKVTITATVGDKKATCEVEVGEWIKYNITGSMQGWKPDHSGIKKDKYAMVQDKNDKHLWTIDVNLYEGDLFKITVGTNWDGALNAEKLLGENIEKDTTSPKLSCGGPGDHNVLVNEDGYYSFTIKTEKGGALKSFTYVRTSDPIEEEDE